MLKNGRFISCFMLVTLIGLLGSAHGADGLFELDVEGPKDPTVQRARKLLKGQVDRAKVMFNRTTENAHKNYQRVLQAQLKKKKAKSVSDRDGIAAIEAELKRVGQLIEDLKANQISWRGREPAQGGAGGGAAVANKPEGLAAKRWAASKVTARQLTPVTTGDAVVPGDAQPPKWRRKTDFVIDDFESGKAISDLVEEKGKRGAHVHGEAPTAFGGRRRVLIGEGAVLRLGLTDGPDVVQAAGIGHARMPSSRITFLYELPNRAAFDATAKGNAFYFRLRRDPGRGQIGFTFINKGSSGGGAKIMLNGKREYIVPFNGPLLKRDAVRLKDLLGFGFTFHFHDGPGFIEIEEWGITRR